MAGITVAAVALPLALAFAVSSGATAAAGLITSVLAGIIGGKDEQGNHADTRTAEQREILRLLVKQLKERFPGVTVHGHREFNRQKVCPCFDVATQL